MIRRSTKKIAAAAILSAGCLLPANAFAQSNPVPNVESGLARAQELGAAFSSVAERVSPAVVSLRVEAEVPARSTGSPFGFPFPFGSRGHPEDPQLRRGGGSGVVIRGDGHILTNNHVVEGARRIEVAFQDGRVEPGEVVGADPASDLAVVRVRARGLPAASFADVDRARVGEWVVAIGAPYGLEYSVTTGILSAKGRGGLGANEIEDYLQTDASINPGNSGGPLVNLRGEVLGINTMIVGRGTGIGFAIPSNLARTVANQLIDTGRVRRSWIGVGFQELTPELASHFGTTHRSGALVGEVVPGGPAARAGVRAGDVIVSVGGNPIRQSRELLRAVLRAPVGTTLELGVLRNRQPQSLRVVTAERRGTEPARSESRPRSGRATPDRFGLGLQPLNPELRRRLGYRGQGRVVVTRVQRGSAADRAGLEARDVILSADRREVRREADIFRAMDDGEALLRVIRGERAFFTVLRNRDR